MPEGPHTPSGVGASSVRCRKPTGEPQVWQSHRVVRVQVREEDITDARQRNPELPEPLRGAAPAVDYQRLLARLNERTWPKSVDDRVRASRSKQRHPNRRFRAVCGGRDGRVLGVQRRCNTRVSAATATQCAASVCSESSRFPLGFQSGPTLGDHVSTCSTDFEVGGLSITCWIGAQLRVCCDQRSGLRRRARSYSPWRRARIVRSVPTWRSAGDDLCGRAAPGPITHELHEQPHAFVHGLLCHGFVLDARP